MGIILNASIFWAKVKISMEKSWESGFQRKTMQKWRLQCKSEEKVKVSKETDEKGKTSMEK